MKNIKKLVLLAILIVCSSVNAQRKSKIIVFSKTAGYRHQSIETGVKAIKKLGSENNFIVEATEDADELFANLKRCKAVIFLNTTGDVFNEEQQKAFKKYMKKGGGFVGIHAAADTEYDWPWYGKMVGAYFISHPHQQKATINVVDKKHLATDFLDAEWIKFDEWYNYKQINTSSINVLMKLDEKSYSGGKNGENHPIAWYHEFGGGKAFYTGLGHTKISYTNEKFLKHVLGGIQYATGKKMKRKKR